MIEKCADVIADWLVRKNAVDKEEGELYRYAVHILILSFVPIVFAIVVGMVIGCVKRSIAIMIPFMTIRKFSGGYHTKHSWTCLIGSCLLLLLCILLSFHVECGYKSALITAIASMSLIYHSPIDNENRRLSKEEHGSYKKITVMLVLLFTFTAIIFFTCRLYMYSVCISIGIMLSSLMQIPCIIPK